MTIIHGHYKGKKASRTYRIWRNMRNRCEREYHDAYKYYGARGIVVCDRWKKFGNFLEDMGVAPDGASIDRIDNNGNYEIGNCRWVAHKEQCRNRSSNRILVVDGKTKSVAEWAECLGLNAKTIYTRLSRGDSPSRALRTV